MLKQHKAKQQLFLSSLKYVCEIHYSRIIFVACLKVYSEDATCIFLKATVMFEHHKWRRPWQRAPADYIMNYNSGSQTVDPWPIQWVRARLRWFVKLTG